MLAVSNREERTVAHELAWYGHLPRECMTPEVLALAYQDGRTVAHVLAWCGRLPRECMTPEVFALSSRDGWTVADVLRANAEKYQPLDLSPYLDAYEAWRREGVPGGRGR
jgi:hypothetical protein